MTVDECSAEEARSHDEKHRPRELSVLGALSVRTERAGETLGSRESAAHARMHECVHCFARRTAFVAKLSSSGTARWLGGESGDNGAPPEADETRNSEWHHR